MGLCAETQRRNLLKISGVESRKRKIFHTNNRVKFGLSKERRNNTPVSMVPEQRGVAERMNWIG